MRRVLTILLLLNITLLAKDYALIIGIAKYKNLKGLSHISNDILIYRKILQNRAVYNIKELRDNQATRYNIIKYLEFVANDIERREDKSSRFFMFFSGHGISTKYLQYVPTISRYLTKSGVILPCEYSPEDIENSVIIGKRDIRPYLTKIDKYVKESLYHP